MSEYRIHQLIIKILKLRCVHTEQIFDHCHTGRMENIAYHLLLLLLLLLIF